MTTKTSSRDRYPWVHPMALVSSLSAILIFGVSTVTAELITPGYDVVRQTISELAAGDAPTRILVTIAFVLTGVCHMLTAIFTPALGIPGRVALFTAGVCSQLVAAFPLPTVAGTSVEHRFSAMLFFVIMATWPLLSMRTSREFPWIIRPWGSIASTAFIATFCFIFLGVWASADQSAVGIWERVANDIEGIWPAIVVITLWVGQRKRSAKNT